MICRVPSVGCANPQMSARYGNTEAELIEMARTIPLGGKMLMPDQIARAAVFLASEDANAITGQVLHVNGGSYMA
ncbi:MAG: SDR family oxidoreductase [Alphaproteobacteria bacterium]|nr:SDR family oxidoreductase [Alphaproteobacteria bacterium]